MLLQGNGYWAGVSLRFAPRQPHLQGLSLHLLLFTLYIEEPVAPVSTATLPQPPAPSKLCLQPLPWSAGLPGSSVRASLPCWTFLPLRSIPTTRVPTLVMLQPATQEPEWAELASALSWLNQLLHSCLKGVPHWTPAWAVFPLFSTTDHSA